MSLRPLPKHLRHGILGAVYNQETGSTLAMCGRFVLKTPFHEIARALGLSNLPNLEPRYNICPTQPVAVVTLGKGGRKAFTLHRWGLIPSWTKDPTIGDRLFNARAETLAEKPAFKGPFRRRRCLIPANGFYEWKSTGGRKQPHYIARPDRGLMAFAGIWDDWLGADGSEVQSCAVITTAAGPDVAAIHHRMPVILSPRDYNRWLYDGGEELLRPLPANSLQVTAVSNRVNNARFDDPACLTPLEEAPSPQQGSLF